MRYIFLLLLFPVQLIAQNTFSAIVSNQYGNPIAYAKIMIVASSEVFKTDRQGKFEFTAHSDSVLIEIRNMGLNGQIIKQHELLFANNFTKISMISPISTLNSLNEENGFVQSLSSDKFNRGFISSFPQLLTGRLAGLSVIGESGSPTSDYKIKIRGGSNLASEAYPLIILNGTPMNVQNGVSSLLSSINPNDIERITVLKDASSIAIYGLRASDGVILIDTKKGQLSNKININYTGKLAFSQMPEKRDILSSDEFRQTVIEKTTEGVLPSDSPNLLGNSNTDWQDEIYDSSISFENYINLTGNLKKIPYSISFGNFNQTGILKNSDLKRNTMSLSLQPSFLNEALSLNINANYSSVNSNSVNQQVIINALTYDPTQPIFLNNSSSDGYSYYENMNQPISISADNPVALQNLSSRKLENEQFIGNGKIAYQIPFLKGLTATLNLGIEKAFFNDTQSESKLLASRLRNTLQTSDNTQTTSLVEPSLHYSIDLDSNSSLTLFIGYNRVHLNSENTLYKDIFVGGTLSFLGDLPSLSVNLTEQSLKAYFANFQYNFKNKLFLNTSFRTDFTDYVVGNKSHLSYGVSLTWNLLESKLFDSYSKISDLRLTASHGQIEHVPFGLFTQLSVSRINSPSTGIPLPELKNSYYTDYNLGVSLGFFENKLTGGFNYFSRKNNDLTGVFISYTGTNNSNRTIRNLADTKSEGFEVYANATVKSSVKFNWNVGFNLTYISNEVENILGGNQSLVEDKYFTFFNSVYPRFSVGETPNTFYAHQQLYDGNGNPAEGAYQDFNSDLQIDNSDLQPIGQENAKVLIGVSSAVSYKSFTFSFNGRANLGQSVFDRTDAVYGNYNSINNTNYLGNVTSSISNSNFNRSQSLSSYYIKKASFFKMDNMTITYTFPKISRKSTSLALDFTIQNAFTISQFDEQDPETINGIIQPNYLRARIWTTGLSFSF